MTLFNIRKAKSLIKQSEQLSIWTWREALSWVKDAIVFLLENAIEEDEARQNNS